MADLHSKLNTLYSLEQLSAGNTAVHRLHPMAKLTVTVVYLVCTVSFPQYALAALTPMLFYPVLMIALAEIPYRMIFQRALVALPFCLFAGISNLLLDRRILWVAGAFPVSAGAVSLLTLLLRTLLCVSAVLILVAVTPFTELTDQLRRLHVPELCVMLLEMIYRYIGVLLEEAASMVTAYRLRGNGRRWPDIRQFGPLVGQLLLRSADRAERVYQAMQCRCWQLRDVKKRRTAWRAADMGFLLLGCGSSVLFRLLPLPEWLGGVFPW